MCTVSMVGDFYRDRWTQPPPMFPDHYMINTPVTRGEFDALKREVAEMKELLKAAKRIDEVTGQPDCEMADKVEVLRRVADLVGVDLDDVLGPRSV
jgi:hypothetical protein